MKRLFVALMFVVGTDALKVKKDALPTWQECGWHQKYLCVIDHDIGCRWKVVASHEWGGECVDSGIITKPKIDRNRFGGGGRR